MGAVLLFTSMLWAAVPLADINRQLSEFGLRFKHPGQWEVERSSVAGGPERQVRTMILNRGEVSLELSILSPISAENAKQEAGLEYSSILSAYKAAVTPYAGSVSKKLSCGARFVPKDVRAKVAGREVRTVVGFATLRKAFGACTEEEAALEFAFASMPLPKGSLLKVTAFRKTTGALKPDYWRTLLADITTEEGR